MEIRNISRRRPRSVDDAELPVFHFVLLQRTAKKLTEILNACAQLLFCSLNLLFGDFLEPSSGSTYRRRRGLLKFPYITTCTSTRYKA